MRYPNARRYVSAARRAVVDYARACGLCDRAIDDLHYAAGEALANAAEHGHRDGTYISVRCWIEESAVVVEVEDDGTGFDPGQPSERRDNSMRGYGITLMQALVDRVVYDPNGRRVRLYKRINAECCKDSGPGESSEMTG